MRTRGIAVLLALLLAAGATAAVFMYVRNVRDEAPTSADSIRVVVAKDNIRGGTNLDNLIAAGGFTTKLFPRDVVIEGAVTDLVQLQHRTTTSFIAAGEQLTTKRLSGSEVPTGGVLNIPPGHQAVTLQLNSERNVAGFIAQGDHIQLFAALKPGGTQETVTVTVVPDVEVLRVGAQSTTTDTTGDADGTLITLALLPNDVARVIEARESGNVWFSLLPPSQAGERVRPVQIRQLLR